MEDRWVYGGTPDAGRHPAVPEYRLEYRGGYWALVDNLTNHEVSRHLRAREAEKEAMRLTREWPGGAMSEKTAEDWGRVAVALPGWRWLPGMLDTDGDRWGGVTLHDGAREVLRAVSAPKQYAYEWRDRRPDPDDPATAGCLLALVQGAIDVSFQCSAWWTTYNVRCSRLTVGMTGDGDKWEVRAHGHDPHHNAGWSKPVATGSSLGRACIAAAEALGRWPGGEG
jgi:hypothetical protein